MLNPEQYFDADDLQFTLESFVSAQPATQQVVFVAPDGKRFRAHNMILEHITSESPNTIVVSLIAEDDLKMPEIESEPGETFSFEPNQAVRERMVVPAESMLPIPHLMFVDQRSFNYDIDELIKEDNEKDQRDAHADQLGRGIPPAPWGRVEK